MGCLTAFTPTTRKPAQGSSLELRRVGWLAKQGRDLPAAGEPGTSVPSVPLRHQTPHAASSLPQALGGNLSPSPSVAIKRKKDLSRCQTQQALVSPSPRYFLMTLAQTAPHPLLLSQSYIAQPASSTIAIRKTVPKVSPDAGQQYSAQTPGPGNQPRA